MAELIKLLGSNGPSKCDLLQALVSQSSSLNIAPNNNASGVSTTSTTQQGGINNINDKGGNGNTITAISTEATTTTTTRTGNNHINTPISGNVGDVDISNSTKNINLNVNLNAARPVSPGSQQQGIDTDQLSNSLTDIKRVIEQVKEGLGDKRRLLIGQVTDITTQAHMSTTLNTQASIREANERIDQQQGAQTNTMPDVSKLSINPSVMWQHFLTSMVPEMTKVVNFSKRLPGFSDVDTDDQVKLIKQGMFEVMISRITLLIDHVNDTMIDPSLKMKTPRAVVRQMSPLGPFIDQFFEIAQQTNPLNLTDGENGLFGAVLMFRPDRHGLKNVSAVQTIQQLYLQALYLLMRHNHKDAEETFRALVSSIPAIRKVNDEHFRSLNNLKIKSTAEFDSHFPQLHREVFDTRQH